MDDGGVVPCIVYQNLNVQNNFLFPKIRKIILGLNKSGETKQTHR